eukprot:jgi/Botrbrau1/16226/Bobra.0066s0012.1
MIECPNAALPAPATPVCDGTISLFVDNTNGVPTCTLQQRCPNGEYRCPCWNVFPTPCGTVNGSVYIDVNLQNVQNVAGFLQTIGLSDVQTIVTDFAMGFRGPASANYVWNIDILPKLEVVQGTTYLRSNADNQNAPFTILPGPGLGKLRAIGRLSVTDGAGALQNTNFAFLSSLVCAGRLDLEGVSHLTSLQGFEGIADGVPNPPGGCYIYNVDSASTLSNVSALAAFGRCGGNVRPDDNGKPCLGLPCGNIYGWNAFCGFVTSGTCN